MLRLRIILNFSLKLKLALYSSIKQLSGLCEIDCQWTILEIDSINVFDNISVPLLLRCSFDPFKCLVVIVLSCYIKKIFFSLHNSFKCRFVSKTLCWWPSFQNVMYDSVTSQELLFTYRANPKIVFAICSGRWFVDISFVPTWIIRWCRFSLREGLT